MDLLRDIRYTDIQGKARLFGKEGTVTLDISGKDGHRTFVINLHDYSRRLLKSFIPF